VNLNSILEIESFFMSQFILGTLTHHPKIFFANPRFRQKIKVRLFWTEKFEGSFFVGILAVKLVQLLKKNVVFDEGTLVDFMEANLCSIGVEISSNWMEMVQNS